MKKLRLFYWEDALDAWTPVPEKVEHIVNIENFSEEGEELEVKFKVFDMTDDEMDGLPCD